MNTDNVKILFHIDSSLFLDCFTVWVDWKYPFLPRIGNYVKGDISDWLFELESGHVYDVSFIKS